MKLTVKNPSRSRKWGFGYETQPERNSTRILPPSRPDYTGTLAQVREAIDNDRTLASFKSGGTFVNMKWFYAGQMIEGVDDFMMGEAFSDFLTELDFERESGRTIDSITLNLAGEPKRAGRPPVADSERMVKHMIALRPDEWERFDAVPGRSRRDKILYMLMRERKEGEK